MRDADAGMGRATEASRVDVGKTETDRCPTGLSVATEGNRDDVGET